MPGGLDQLKKEINEIKTLLENEGYDLNNTTVTLIGTASSEPATNRHELPQHPKHTFGGALPQTGWVSRDSGAKYERVTNGNQWLAKARANNIAKLMKQMIPGIKVNTSSKVEKCAGEACRYIKASVSGTKKTKDVLTQVNLTLNLSDQSGYWTTNEWNARKSSENCKGDLCGCQIKNATDKRED